MREVLLYLWDPGAGTPQRAAGRMTQADGFMERRTQGQDADDVSLCFERREWD